MSTSESKTEPLNEKIRTKDVILTENVTFESLLLSEKVLQGLKDSDFKKPSPIQLKAIPVGRCGFDLIVKSKSGTGKTLVFTVIALETVDLKISNPQVLIITPTREISVQIHDVIKSISEHYSGLKLETFIGGFPIESDKLKCKCCHIAIGTPGRLKALIDQGILITNSVRLFVVDEADKLMEASFQNDINAIYNKLPQNKQIITTSATYPNNLDAFLSKYMLSPTRITSELETPMLLGLKQFVSVIDCSNSVAQQMLVKNELLASVLQSVSFTQCLVFSNYQVRAESVSNMLNQKGWNSLFISGAQSQTDRLNAVSNLRDFKCKVLLSTDLTARGIDAANVDLVINYDIPDDPMTYLHRMGRAGRYGSLGVCINLCLLGKEFCQLQNILGAIGGCSFKIPKLPKFENGIIYDLQTIDCNTLDSIEAIVPESNYFVDKVNCEVFKLKKSKLKSHENSSSQKNSVKLLENINVTEFLKESKNNIEDDEYTSLNPAFLLDAMLQETEINNSDSQPDILNESYRKRKRSPIDSKKYSNNEMNTSNTTNLNVLEAPNVDTKTNTNIFCTNKALLSVTKLLTHNESATEDAQTIGECLQLLKEEQSCDKIVNIYDVLENVQSVETEKETPERSNIENLFQLGYNYLTKSGSKHWLDSMPESLVKTFKKPVVTSDSVDHVNRESSSDTQLSAENMESSELENDTTYDFMKWIPVDPNETKNAEYSNFQKHIYNIKDLELVDDTELNISYNNQPISNTGQFVSYFDECSTNLWQNGLSFNTAEEFERWYLYVWKEHVDSIRNYVQQNIYVSEMSKYQEHYRNK